MATGFDRVDGFATAGGNDTAYLYDSTKNDTFWGDSTTAELYGTGYYNSGHGFEQVHAFFSSVGNDQADLFGIAGDDTFDGTTNLGKLTGAGYSLSVWNADRVTLDLTSGGDDTVQVATGGDVDAVDYLFQQLGA